MAEAHGANRRALGHAHRQLSLAGPLVVVWSVILTVLAIARSQELVPLDDLFLDPSTLADAPWYAGILNELGVFGWSVAVVVAAGGASIARAGGRTSAAAFLGSGAALSAVLLVDDLARVHSSVAPRLGVTKPAAQSILALIACVWIVVQHREIRRTRWGILAISVVSLGCSVGVDLLPGLRPDIFVEDAPKLLGIAGWATYFWLTAADVTHSMLDELHRLVTSPGTNESTSATISG